MELSAVFQKEIVSFLVSLPNIEDSNNQRALIESAGLDVALKSQIRFEGSTIQFFQLLVPMFLRYGILDDGRDAIVALLEATKTYIGQNRKAECEELLQKLRQGHSESIQSTRTRNKKLFIVTVIGIFSIVITLIVISVRDYGVSTLLSLLTPTVTESLSQHENKEILEPVSSSINKNDGQSYTSLNNIAVYVWDFATRDGKKNDLTSNITSEFEDALIGAGFVLVLERQSYDRLLSQKDNEKAILNIEGVSTIAIDSLKAHQADAVVFGEVYDDINDGKIKVTVTFQTFDSKILEQKSIRFSRGKRFDSESRIAFMEELVKRIFTPNRENVADSPQADSFVSEGNDEIDSNDNRKYYVFMDDKSGQYGIKTEEGNITVMPQYDYIDTIVLSEEANLFTSFRIDDEENGEYFWGVVNSETGKEVIPPKYKRIVSFFDEPFYFEVTDFNEKKGVINFEGRIVVPFTTFKISHFSSDIFKVYDREKAGLVQNGEWIIPMKYQQIGSDINNDAGFGEGLTLINLNDKYGLIDKNANIILDPIYDFIDSNHEGAINFKNDTVAVSNNNKIGLIDTKGNIVIPIEYDYLRSFSEGLAVAAKGESLFYISKDNDIAIPEMFDSARDFKDGLAEVLKESKWYKIDKKGRCRKDCPQERIEEGYEVKVIDTRMTEDFKCDITLKNVSDTAIVINKISVKIIVDGKSCMLPPILPTAEYLIDVDEIGEGNTAYLDVSHLIDSGKADRFLIDFSTTCLYLVEVTLFYDSSKYIVFRIDI